MSKQKQYRIAAGLAVLTLVAGGKANALDYDFYASFRFHAEAVNPDDETTLDSYDGWRDAYSRIGVNVSHDLSDSLTAYGKLELPLDIANTAFRDPYDQEENLRVGKLGLKGDFGDLAIGQMWMPFYNAIVVHFDAFSSYYSGFTTYSTFRKDDTISYYSPNFGGFSGAIAYSFDNGAIKNNGDLDDRLQATLSYNFGDVTISGGIDDLGGANDSSIIGTSITWQATDALFLAAKYEEHHSDLNSGYGADGDHVMNILAAYTVGKNTFKATVAEVEGFGETVFHLGWDHQYQDNIKFFVEYYNEEETAAITSERGGAIETCWSCSGGQVFVTGLRYDF